MSGSARNEQASKSRDGQVGITQPSDRKPGSGQPLDRHPGSKQPPYLDSSQPVQTRVRDLLGRMTLEEKVAQLGAGLLESVVQDGAFSPRKMEELVENLAIGSLHNFLWQNIKDNELNLAMTNEVQRYLREKTRLGIPAIITAEGVHGHQSDGATIFPHAIALASSWDTELLEEVAGVVAREASSSGARQILAPVLDLAREPRWGRCQETYGEDPYLTSRMGVAYVRGIQGEGPHIDLAHACATPKHFAAHGSPLGGINLAPVPCGERELRTVYLQPFEAAVREAGALSVMCCYSELDGVPAARNRKLLTEILRNEWGFEGYVYSDWGAIEMLFNFHRTARNLAEAGKQALEAGVDMDSPGPEAFGKRLLRLAENGQVSLAVIDEAVRRILTVKFRLGLFENPFGDPDLAQRVRNCDEHRALARRAAVESIVLLKNAGGILPLSPTVRSIAVIGPNADVCRLGDYAGGGVRLVSLLEGIRAAVSKATIVNHARGCGVYELSTDGIAEAVEIARRSEVAIVVLGESSEVCEEGVDQNDLELPGVQLDLLKAVHATGTPAVVVLMNGRPLAIPWIAEHVPAVLEAWFAGEEQGNALADILFGRANPSGRLTVSLPRSTGHIPSYYNCKPSGRGYYRKAGEPGKPGRDYVFSSPWPLYPFGHGLSYTTFAYSDPVVAPRVAPPNGAVEVSVTVRNSGSRRGAEVVQLYLRDMVSSVTTPMKQLKGFRKIWLDPGEQRRVGFVLKVEELALLDTEMRWVVEPGEFQVMVGELSGSFEVASGDLGKAESGARE